MQPTVCTKCLMLSTRPRLTFDGSGVCSACQWAEAKKTTLDWSRRKQDLIDLCDKYRILPGFNVIVPVSGGKDSSMVAHKLKHEYGMTPLCVNISHSISCLTELNDVNLHNFISHGFDCIRIYPNQHVLRTLDKVGLVEYGQPYFGWMSAVALAPLKIALLYNVSFIMYGENGEVEYGGTTKLKHSPTYALEDMITFGLSGIHPESYLEHFTAKDLSWWLPPSREQIEALAPSMAFWSYFEPWDSNYNRDYARKHIGLAERDSEPSGTYVKFAQNDSILYPLHTYFMYLKFGFGRCTQDVCIDIRSGKLSREEGKQLILKYDEVFPDQYWDQYLEYYGLTADEMHAVIDKFANTDLLEKKNGRWVKTFALS